MSQLYQLSLPGTGWQLEPQKAKREVAVQPVQPCPECLKRATPKPRSVMPLTHAVETVRGILIDRLDDLCAHWLDNEGKHFHLTYDQWIELFQSLQLKFFPDEMGDGDPYTPCPSARMDVPPLIGGLVPKLPTVAIYAKYLQAGKQSPAAELKMPDGSPVFNDKDLIRLGERIEHRATA